MVPRIQQLRLSPDIFLFFLWPRVQPHLGIIRPLDGNMAIAAILQHIITPPPVWRLASIQGNFLALPAALAPEELLLCSWWKQTLCQGRGGLPCPGLPWPCLGTRSPTSASGLSAARAQPWPQWDTERHPAAAPSSACCVQGLEGEGKALPALCGSQAAPELAPDAPLLLAANLQTPWRTMASRGRSQPCHLLSQPRHPQTPHPPPALLTLQWWLSRSTRIF